MKKSTKVVLIISGVVIVLLGTLIAIITYFESLQPEEIEYPGSGLSGSIFETQNTSYAPNASLPQQHKYENVPYLLDVPQASKAQIEEGTTYKLNNYLYIYTSEFPFNTDIDYTLSRQLGKILMLDANDDMTFLETMKEEVGYKNGYGVVYDVKNMYVSNGTDSVKAVVMTYYIELPEESEDVVIGALSTVESNDAIRNMKDILDAELITFRYDEEQQRDIEERLYEEQRAEEQKQATIEREEQAEQDALEKQQKEEEAAQKKMTTTSDVDVDLEEDYIKLNLALSWSSSNAVSDILLISPNGETYDPDTIGTTRSSFTVPNANAGTWTLRITGVNVGSVNIVMTEMGDIGNTSTTYIEETSSSSNSSESESISEITSGE